jgi:hypothetical protein
VAIIITHRRKAIRAAIEHLLEDLAIALDGLQDGSDDSDVALALEHIPLSLTSFTKTLASLDVPSHHLSDDDPDPNLT